MSVGDDAADKQEAMKRIVKSLDWLSNAHAALDGYVRRLPEHPDEAKAAKTIHFKFYRDTPRDIKTALESAIPHTADTRTKFGDVVRMREAWDAYAKASSIGDAGQWNAERPYKTIAEMDAKRKELLETNGGSLRKVEDKLSEQLAGCGDAMKNMDGVPVNELAALITSKCPAPQGHFDPRVHGIRKLQFVTAREAPRTARLCPPGHRLPLSGETELFGPWSREFHRTKGGGLWVDDKQCFVLDNSGSGGGWLRDGKVECPDFAAAQKPGLSICISKELGVLPPP